MEARFCSSCKKPNPDHVIYCYHCGVYIDQQPPDSYSETVAQPSSRFQPSPFAGQPLLNQPSVQLTVNRVLKCVDCRLLNYSGEETCKRCGGQLIDRNATNSQPLQPNQSLYQPASYLSNDYDDSEEMKKAKKSIKNAWITGVISGAFTLIFVLILTPFLPGMIDTAYVLIAGAIILGLSYGIYRKSRACAIILLSFYALDKILFYIESGKTAGILVTMIFIYYFAKGIEGTFAYHRLMREKEAQQNYRLSPGHDAIY